MHIIGVGGGGLAAGLPPHGMRISCASGGWRLRMLSSVSESVTLAISAEGEANVCSAPRFFWGPEVKTWC